MDNVTIPKILEESSITIREWDMPTGLLIAGGIFIVAVIFISIYLIVKFYQGRKREV